MFLSLLVIIWVCSQVSNCDNIASDKRKLCTEFTVDDYKAEKNPINTNYNLTKSQCMLACAREKNCSAFNFRWIDGACALLLVISSCMVGNTTADWVYVSVSQCDFVVPWYSRTPAREGPWDWVTIQSDSLSNSDLLGMTDVDDTTRFVSRVFYKGMYLPGWATGVVPNFRAIDPSTGILINCPSGQFLSFPVIGGIFPDWEWINAGDPVPSGAIVGGHGPRGEPLFVARYEQNTIAVAGYYNLLGGGEGYFPFNGLKQPAMMQILIKNTL